MISATGVIELISKTSSTNDKLYLLKKNENVVYLKDILKFIYNPYIKTGISDAKLNKAMSQIKSNLSEDITVSEIIEYLTNHQTGRDADAHKAAHFVKYMKETYLEYPYVEEVARGIVTQNLKIGVSAKSLNTVYGKDFIPMVGCMLGTLYGDVNSANVKWPCIVTEKLDGIRRILIKERGVVKMYSRSGHYDPYCIEILEEAKHLPDNYVYDGELLAKGEFKDSIALRQATNSIANSKGEKTGLTYNIFDMIPINEFYAGASSAPALARKIRLGATLMDESISLLDDKWAQLIQAFGVHEELMVIKPVPILGYVQNFHEVTPIVEAIWGRGGEGVMLNTDRGLYEIKRSKQLLKIKHTEELTLKVVGITEGTGKFEDTLGALVVEYKGNKVGVGSGFTDAQRREIWDNPDDYLDRYIEVETFGESKNAAGIVSINCPIFKRFVGDEE